MGTVATGGTTRVTADSSSRHRRNNRVQPDKTAKQGSRELRFLSGKRDTADASFVGSTISLRLSPPLFLLMGISGVVRNGVTEIGGKNVHEPSNNQDLAGIRIVPAANLTSSPAGISENEVYRSHDSEAKRERVFVLFTVIVSACG